MNFAGDVVKIGQIDIAPIQAEVESLGEEVWREDQRRQEIFPAHARTEMIKLLFDADYRHRDPTEHPAYARLAPVLVPAVGAIRAFYERTLRQRRTIDRHGPGYFIRIILTRLAPGGEIDAHVDGGDSLKRCHRIHLPVASHPDCLFRVGDTTMHMAPGDIWEINNRRFHAVTNASDAARVHLILDYVQPGERVFDVEGPITA